MPHRLLARDSHHYLSPLGVVTRLKSEFDYVESDAEAGRRYVLETIEELQANKWSRLFDINHEYLEQLDRVKERVLYVCFGDNPGSESGILSTYVIPGTPLLFDYSSYVHEQAVEPLLVRCAAVLGYDIVKDRRTIKDPAYRGRERRRFLDRRSLIDRRKSA